MEPTQAWKYRYLTEIPLFDSALCSCTALFIYAPLAALISVQTGMPGLTLASIKSTLGTQLYISDKLTNTQTGRHKSEYIL